MPVALDNGHRTVIPSGTDVPVWAATMLTPTEYMDKDRSLVLARSKLGASKVEAWR
jgi:hypothetical protein